MNLGLYFVCFEYFQDFGTAVSFQQHKRLPAHCLRGNLVFEIPAGDWGYILWLGIINTGLGCFLYFSSINRLPAQSVAICGYIEPLSAVLLSVLFLNETMSPLQMAGAVLIIGGALYGELGKKKSKNV